MYQDYLQKLNFGSTTDSINSMKDRALTVFSNPLEQQYEGLQMKIGQLMGNVSTLDDDKDSIIDKVTEGITTALGTGFESGGLFVGMRKFYEGAKNKLKAEGSTKDDVTADVAKKPAVKSTKQLGDKQKTQETEGKSDEPDGPDPDAAQSAPYREEGDEAEQKPEQVDEGKGDEPDEAKEDEPDEAKEDEPDEAKEDEPDEAKEDEPDEAKEDEPEAKEDEGEGEGGEVEEVDPDIRGLDDFDGNNFLNAGNDEPKLAQNGNEQPDFDERANNPKQPDQPEPEEVEEPDNFMKGVGNPGDEIEMQNMGADADDIVDNIPKAIGGEIEMQDMGGDIGDVINNAQGAVEDAVGGIGDAVQGAVGDIAGGIGDAVQGAVGGISDFFGNLAGNVASFAKNGLSSLNSIFNGVTGTAEGAAEGASSAVGSIGDLVSGGISGFAQGGIKGAITGVSNAIQNTAGKVTSTVAEVGDVAADVGETAAATVGETAAEVAGTVAGVEAVGAATEAIPVIGQVIGTLLMISGAIFGGIESGEEAQTDQAKEADEGAAAADQVKEAQLKSQELTEQQKLENTQFTGSNVISSISSLFGQGNTATSF